jgi:hypothetical protein
MSKDIEFLVIGDYGLESQTILKETPQRVEAARFLNGYTRNDDMLGGYDSIELGYFQADGEWITLAGVSKEQA